MAHCEKYGRSAIGHMLEHYARECEATLERENVHESETGRNYAIAYGTDEHVHEYEPRLLSRAVKRRIAKAVQAHERNTGKSLRKDGVVMADWVVTLPEDWPDDRDPKEFFEETLEFARERYGSRCVTGGFVHMDETTPHMHMPVIPMIDPEGTDTPRLCAKKKISRTDLRSFHQDLQAHLKSKRLPGTVVELRRDGMPKWTSKLTQEELREYKESLEQAKRAGMALGRAESESELRIAESKVQTLKNENVSLREALDCVKEQAQNASKGVNKYLLENNKLRAKIEALEAKEQERKQQEQRKKRRNVDIPRQSIDPDCGMGF